MKASTPTELRLPQKYSSITPLGTEMYFLKIKKMFIYLW